MINVSNATKTAYKSDSVNKNLTVTFPDLNLTFTNTDIIQSSFSLEEKISDGEELSFVGCLASIMKIELLGVVDDLVNNRVTVSVQASGNDVDAIPLFSGTVQSVEKTTYQDRKKIVAYDDFYRLSKLEATSFYNNHYDTTILQLFKDLMEFCELEYNEDIEFVNGHLPAWCSLTQSASAISALTILKSICQINALFGIMTREGVFDVLVPYDTTDRETEEIPYYKDCKVEEYQVHAPDCVVLRASDTDGGYAYYTTDEPKNRYIIQSNMFAFDFTQEESLEACENIYRLVCNFAFTPFNADINGLPYVLPGDMISIPTYDGTEPVVRQFVVMSRTLQGIQAMRDEVEADGDENMSELVSDIGTSLESLKSQLGEYSLVRYDYVNGRDISLTEDWEVLFSIKYEAKLKVPFFIAEIKLNVIGDTYEETNVIPMTMKQLVIDTTATSGVKEDTVTQNVTVVNTKTKEPNVYFKYVLDDIEPEYYPQTQFCNGTHLMHLYYPLKNLNVAGGSFTVYAKKSDGFVTIPTEYIHASLIGQGKSTVGEWDGKIELEDYMDDITLKGTIKLTPFTESVTNNLITPNVSTFSASISGIKLKSKLILTPFTATPTVNEVIKTAHIDTDHSSNYEFDRTLVDISNNKFELATNTSYNGVQTSIDEGYLSKGTVNTDNYESIESIGVDNGE